MLYKVILLLFILASCGKNPFDDDHKHNPVNRDPRTNITSDATFDPYVEQFEEDYGQYIGDIPINFGELEDQKIGVCYTWDSGHAEIEIDLDFWKVATELEKKALVYHELGHCELSDDRVEELEGKLDDLDKREKELKEDGAGELKPDQVEDYWNEEK